jgi:hypothetical protein
MKTCLTISVSRKRKGSWILEPDFTRLHHELPIDGVDRNRDSVIAIKEVVAWQIEQAMLKGNITKVEMAKRIRNSRTGPEPAARFGQQRK